MKNITIETCERLMDNWMDGKGVKHPKYHAQIQGEPGYWACGRTQDEAVGDLIRSHPERFGLQLQYLGKLAR